MDFSSFPIIPRKLQSLFQHVDGFVWVPLHCINLRLDQQRLIGIGRRHEVQGSLEILPIGYHINTENPSPAEEGEMGTKRSVQVSFTEEREE